MKKFKCSRCGKIKPQNEFYKRPERKRGYQYHCIECDRKADLEDRHSKNGVARRTYFAHVRYSKQRNMEKPSYNRIELKEWLFDQPLFHELYDRWAELGYDSWMRPSVDRIDDYKPYTFDNIQLVTWRENNDRAHKDRKNGINNKYNKAVLQYDLNGNFIKEYHSQAYASKVTTIQQSNISSACRNKIKTAGGYIWKFKEGLFDED